MGSEILVAPHKKTFFCMENLGRMEGGGSGNRNMGSDVLSEQALKVFCKIKKSDST